MGAIWTPDKAAWERMFKATARKRDFAAKMLASMTSAELRLWSELSKQNHGTKSRPKCPWRPQVVIKGWIVDFYNDHMLCAVEVDGPVHDQAEQHAKDAIKDAVLGHFGIRVLRVTNGDVFANTAVVVRRIMGYTEDKTRL